MLIIMSELRKLKHSKVLFGIFLLILAFVVYAQYDAATTGITSKGYIVSITLAFFNNLGLILAYVLGAMIYYQDDAWNTFQHMLTGRVSRNQVVGYKLLTIVAGNAGVEIVFIVFALAIHVITGRPVDRLLPEQFVIQAAITFINLNMWGIIAFAITTVTKSITLGILIPFVFTNFEMLVYPYCSKVLLRFLPNYHIRSMLTSSFNNLKSGSMIVFQDTGNRDGWMTHFLYVLIVVGIMIAIVFFGFRKEEVKS